MKDKAKLIEGDSDEYQDLYLIKCQNIVVTKEILQEWSQISSFCGENANLKSLTDFGSSASFINSNSLLKSLSDQIENFIKTGKGLILKSHYQVSVKC